MARYHLRSLCVIILITAALSLTSPAVIEDPTEEIFQELKHSESNSCILLVHRRPCADRCLDEVELIETHMDRFKMLEPSVDFKVMDVAMLHAVQDSLVLDTSHGVYYLYRGESIRVDTNDMEENNSKYLPADISALLQRRLDLIDNWETIRDLNHTYQHLHLFFGERNTEEFKQVEISTKLTSRDIFWIENPEIADLFKITHPGMYTFEKSRNDCIRMRDSLEFSSKIVHFVVTSSRDSPQMFDEVQIQTSIQNEIPVMIVYARSSATQSILDSLLKSTDSLLRSIFHVYQIDDIEDRQQMTYIDECDIGFNWGFTVCILQANNGYLYRWVYKKKVLTFDRFHDFAESFTNKTTEPDLKSENLKSDIDGNVRLLNVASFRQIMEPVAENREKYLVMYYTGDDCESCDKFEKIYKKLAKDTAFKDITFAQINMSRNEVVEVLHLKLPSVHYTTGYDDPHVQVYHGAFESLKQASQWLHKAKGDHYEKAKKASEIELEETDL